MASKIIDTIKALLANAASITNPELAALYLKKAHDLMEKHQLEAGDLETDDPIDKTVGPKANGGASPDWDFQLMFAVARYFGCKSIQWWSQKNTEGVTLRAGQYTMQIVGRESARITAIEMHKYLVKTVRRLGRENATAHCKADTMSRRIGRALQIRIGEMTPPEESMRTDLTPAGKNALITLDGVLAKYKELFPDSKPIGGAVLVTKSATALAAGIGLNLQTSSASTLRLK